MNLITSITDYCRLINVSPPRYPFFDIRSFEENMKTVKPYVEPFRHEFYAIALRKSGTNKQVMGDPLSANLFFNSPYQIVTWDIDLNWQGWYIIFNKEFISAFPLWQNWLIDFPFLRLDQSAPFDLPEAEATMTDNIFHSIYNEYHSNHEDKFNFIHTYTHLLLLQLKRNFNKTTPESAAAQQNRTADILLLSRFQTLVESNLLQENAEPAVRQPSFYADKLNVHPNHLNAIVKRIIGRTTSQVIQYHLLNAAKSLLRNNDLSVKEIAFRLHFLEPTHFNSFFKKQTNQTPQQYREQNNL